MLHQPVDQGHHLATLINALTTTSYAFMCRDARPPAMPPADSTGSMWRRLQPAPCLATTCQLSLRTIVEGLSTSDREGDIVFFSWSSSAILGLATFHMDPGEGNTPVG